MPHAPSVCSIPLEQNHAVADELRVNGELVEWWRAGRVYQRFSVGKSVTHALFATFQQEQHVVLFCGMAAHAFGCISGRDVLMEYHFVPSRVLSCAQGCVLMDPNEGHTYLMTDPLKLLGLVVPSSLYKLGHELLWFGTKSTSLAVYRTGRSGGVYAIRYLSGAAGGSNAELHPSLGSISRKLSRRLSRRISTGPDFSEIPREELAETFRKEAVLTKVASFQIEGDEVVIEAHLGPSKQEALYLLDRKSHRLHTFLYSSWAGVQKHEVHENISGIAAISGFTIGATNYPYILVLSDDHSLRIWSVWSPAIMINITGSTIKGASGNAFFLDNKPFLAFVSLKDPLIRVSLQILEALAGPQVVAATAARLLTSNTSEWQEFCQVLPTLVNYPGYILHLHFLHEELELSCHGRKDSHRLAEALRSSDIPGLEEYYVHGISSNEFPSIFSCLASLFGREPILYPVSKEFEKIYILTKMVFSFFSLIKSGMNGTALMNEINSLGIVRRLKDFAPAVQVVITHILEFITPHYEIAAPESPDMFPYDERLAKVVLKLQTTDPHRVTRPSEEVFTEVLGRVGEAVALRTLASSYGRGLILYSSSTKLLCETIEVPDLNFSFEFIGSDHVVSYSGEYKNEELHSWGEFAHGCAIGLEFKGPATVTGSWVNPPGDTSPGPSHGGLLYGIGLSGLLNDLEEWFIYRYLGHQSTHNSVGLLLGLAASSRGSMDQKLTKVLSVHVSALLPRGAADLQVNPDVHYASVLALGLLYHGTGHNRMAEKLFSELKTTGSESYRMACGISLGLIYAGKASKLDGSRIAAIALQESDEPDPTQLAAAGATWALLLAYLKSNDHIMAEKLALPPTNTAAQYVRPDIVLLQNMARHVIMWDSIIPTYDWIVSTIPKGLGNPWYLYAEVGACLALGLRYAGTYSSEALEALHTCSSRIDQNEETGLEFPQDFAKEAFRLIRLAMSLVLAGSGDITLTRLVDEDLAKLDLNQNMSEPSRFFRHYNSLSIIGQTLGFLYLGKGTLSFKNDPMSLGLVATSLAPFLGTAVPVVSWAHLRFWASMGLEPRSLTVKDADTGENVRADVVFQGGDSDIKNTMKAQTPCLIPQSTLVMKLSAPGYAPVVHHPANCSSLEFRIQPLDRNRHTLARLLESNPFKDIAMDVLTEMSRNPVRPSDLGNLLLLFAFIDEWRDTHGFEEVARAAEICRLNLWKITYNH